MLPVCPAEMFSAVFGPACNAFGAGRTDYKSMFRFFREARLFWKATDGRRGNTLCPDRARTPQERKSPLAFLWG
jgi:hypothetical protein